MFSVTTAFVLFVETPYLAHVSFSPVFVLLWQFGGAELVEPTAQEIDMLLRESDHLMEGERGAGEA